jgi:hypothetical protein
MPYPSPKAPLSREDRPLCGNHSGVFSRYQPFVRSVLNLVSMTIRRRSTARSGVQLTEKRSAPRPDFGLLFRIRKFLCPDDAKRPTTDGKQAGRAGPS